MSRCFKRYDVKHLRHGGCVPATREIVGRYNLSGFLLRSASQKSRC